MKNLSFEQMEQINGGGFWDWLWDGICYVWALICEYINIVPYHDGNPYE